MSVLDTFRLEGKTALVTGGSKGLGRAMAQALAEAGADIAICSRHEEEAKAAAAEIAQAAGRKTAGFEADVIDRASVARLKQECEAAFGKIDILLNNAGINIRKPTPELTEEDWDAVVDISVKGSFLCSQAFLPGMIERQCCDILIVSSTAAFQSVPYHSVYAATKGFDLLFAEGLAEEVSKSGIHVCALCPGNTETEFHKLADEPEDVGDGRRGPGLAERWQQLERPHVGVETGHLLSGQVQVVDAELAGFAEDVVVDVGDVADTLRLVPTIPQPALEDVVGEVRRGVAQVRVPQRVSPRRI